MRAAALGAEVEWVQGDAEALPFPDRSLDRVLSAFGVQFAPRHEITARELVRVCRPGGAIALANWTPEGFVGQMFAILSPYLPAPPSVRIPTPALGQRAARPRAVLDLGRRARVRTRGHGLQLGSVEEWLEFYETNYGSTIRAKAVLERAGRWGECRAELADFFQSQNRSTDGTGVRIEAEYMLIVARPQSTAPRGPAPEPGRERR